MAKVFAVFLQKPELWPAPYKKGKSHHGSGGVKEEPTRFQDFCNEWLKWSGKGL
jgi:hypothetical protein